MTYIVNHRTSVALVAIAALLVLVASTSAISGHITLAQTNSGSPSNSGVDSSQSNSATCTSETAGGGSTISNSCNAPQTNTHSNSGGVLH
jgi:hypothetical protein